MKPGEISLKSALILLSVAEAAVGHLPRLGIGAPIAQRSAVTQNALTPEGYAFIIWGLIYLALFVYALVFAWRGEARAPALRLAVAMAANTAWALYVQTFSIDAVSVAIILVGLVAALMALGGAAQMTARGIERFLTRMAAGLLAGWLTIAAAANIAAAMQGAGLSFGDVGAPVFALLLLLAFGGLGAIAAGRTRSFWYAGAAAWGLVAIVVARWRDGGTMDLVIAVAALAMALAIPGMAAAARRAPD